MISGNTKKKNSGNGVQRVDSGIAKNKQKKQKKKTKPIVKISNKGSREFVKVCCLSLSKRGRGKRKGSIEHGTRDGDAIIGKLSRVTAVTSISGQAKGWSIRVGCPFCRQAQREGRRRNTAPRNLTPFPQIV